jgi:hypothetical protein
MTIPRHVPFALTALLFMVTQGQSQLGPQDSPGRRGGQGGDASRMYEFLFNGKEVVNRAELAPPLQKIFDRLADKLGVTNGELTRDQINSLGTTPKADRPQKTSPVSPVPSQPVPPASKGGRGFGNQTSANDLEARAGMRTGSPALTVATVPATNAVLVYHSHNLPKELPAWFGQLDTNHDAQIGLYEWKASGRPISEFQRMDRNNDGFLTVEEVLSYLAQTGQLNSNQGRGARSSGVAPSTSMAGSQRREVQPNRTGYAGQTGR